MSETDLNIFSAEDRQDKIVIALDAMGGDFGPEVVIPGADIILRRYRKSPKAKNIKRGSIRFLIFGDQAKINKMLAKHPELNKRALINHTDKIVRSDEKPSSALRNGKGSSMRMAIEAVRDGHADAVVSAGNTGALMALAKIVLRPVEGIHRPAIASVLPTLTGDTVMLDLGANVLVDAENLVQFAVLGSLFATARKDIKEPTIGLLNVGSEEMKGPDHVRAAGKMLDQLDFPGRYHGFVEGDDITKGTVDVVVCDGYAGNIALKTAEGVGKMLGQFFKQSIGADLLAMIGGLLAFNALRRFKHKADPRMYNGGVFLGLNGVCVKSHGGGDALSFSTAVSLAVDLAQHDYVDSLAEDIGKVMSQETILASSDYHD